MNDLPPAAVEMLYPVLVIISLVVTIFLAVAAGLWSGFKWLHRQIEGTSKRIVAPVEERVAVVEKSVEAAHRRIDDWMGARQ